MFHNARTTVKLNEAKGEKFGLESPVLKYELCLYDSEEELEINGDINVIKQ